MTGEIAGRTNGEARVGIFQIAYNDETQEQRDKAFTVLDCRDDPAPQRREIHHIINFHKAGTHRNYDYCGLFSPKFSEKTRISGEQYIRFIKDNPGFDVYFINPFPLLKYYAFNVWEQGELSAPGLCELANQVLAAAGIPVDVRKLPRNTADTLLYCNFWVGNAKFWDEFLHFIGRLIDGLERLPEPVRQVIFGPAPYLTAATYFPFIFERMFSTYLLLRRDIKALPYPFPRDALGPYYFTDMERLLIAEWGPMIDDWDEAGVYDEDKRRIFRALLKITYLYAALRLQVVNR
jgi:hypothetical protein